MNANPVFHRPVQADRPAPGPLRTRSRLVAVGAILAAGLAVMVPALAGPVNVNAADARTLQKELVGIGPAKAKAIVAAREKNGPFKSLEEVARVKGVGKKLVDRNRGNLRLDGKAPPATSNAAAVGAAPADTGSR